MGKGPGEPRVGRCTGTPIIRVATFNCEHLFWRPNLLGFRNNSRASPDLDKVVVLEKLIQKASYSAADKAAILRLVKELSRFIELANLRGKLLTGTGASLRVSASGRGD